MADIQSLLNQIPVSQIAQRLGVDESEARQAIESLVPALVGGMGANAQDPAGAASLSQALSQHENNLLDSGDVDAIDTFDGQKIVQNVFGGQTDQVVSRLGGQTAGGSALVNKLLPMLAPIVMAWLASQISNRVNNPRPQQPEQQTRPQPRIDTGSSGGGLTPVPDAPSAGQGGAPQRGDVLTDILGQVLGGGQQQEQKKSGSIITDILGGLLGGGRR